MHKKPSVEWNKRAIADLFDYVDFGGYVQQTVGCAQMKLTAQLLPWNLHTNTAKAILRNLLVNWEANLLNRLAFRFAL